MNPPKIDVVLSCCPKLRSISAKFNRICDTPSASPKLSLRTIDLSHNNIQSLDQIASLQVFQALETLSLTGNPIDTFRTQSHLCFKTLTTLSMAATMLSSLSSLESFTAVFPNVSTLIVHGTPLSLQPSARLFVIASLASLTSLNSTFVTLEERRDAEIFYVNHFAKLVQSASSEEEAQSIIEGLPRWTELCRTYDRPEIKRKVEKSGPDSNTLEARTAKFTFYISDSVLENARSKNPAARMTTSIRESPAQAEEEDEKPQPWTFEHIEILSPTDTDQEPASKNSTSPIHDQTTPQASSYSNPSNTHPSPHPHHTLQPLGNPWPTISKTAIIPLTIQIYTLKPFVGRLFAIPPPWPLKIRLIYETGEWDPIASTISTTTASSSSSTSRIAGNMSHGTATDSVATKSPFTCPETAQDRNAQWPRVRNTRRMSDGRNLVMREEELVGGTRKVGDWVTASASASTTTPGQGHREEDRDGNGSPSMTESARIRVVILE